MEITAQEIQMLDMAQVLLWKKGANNPNEAMIASQLTQFVQKVAQSQAPKPPEPEKK